MADLTSLDAEGVAAAREYARYELGSAAWADSILSAYLDPKALWARRDKQDAEFETKMEAARARIAAERASSAVGN